MQRTLEALASGRARQRMTFEVIIVDDASESAGRPVVSKIKGAEIRVLRLRERVGVPAARNIGASAATGDVLFMTDAHVSVAEGWDRTILAHFAADRVLAGAVSDPTSAFRAYGCTLVVPFMGTRWVRERPRTLSPIQIPSCAATVVPRRLFRKLGGYDRGMRLYGAAEPEFGVRAWLSGAEVVGVPELEVSHHFKERAMLDRFVHGLRPSMLHNSLRFGLLYLSEAASLQMIRYYAFRYPNELGEAVAMLRDSDVWARRAELARHLANDFGWFVDRFDLKDQEGGEVLR